MVTIEYTYLNKPAGFTNCFFFSVFDFLLPPGIKVLKKLILRKANFRDVKEVAFREDLFFAKVNLKIFVKNSF